MAPLGTCLGTHVEKCDYTVMPSVILWRWLPGFVLLFSQIFAHTVSINKEAKIYGRRGIANTKWSKWNRGAVIVITFNLNRRVTVMLICQLIVDWFRNHMTDRKFPGKAFDVHCLLQLPMVKIVLERTPPIRNRSWLQDTYLVVKGR